MQNVNKIMTEELAASGLDVDRLDEDSRNGIMSMPPVIDSALMAISDKPEGLRIAAAAIRSYARVAEQYAAALDADEPTDREPSAEQERAWDEQYDGSSFGA